MLYQIHFDDYSLFHRVSFVVDDLIYKYKVTGKNLELTLSIEEKIGAIWKTLDLWNKETTVNHDLTLTEEETLFLSMWLQANSNYYHNLAALQNTLRPIQVLSAA